MSGVAARLERWRLTLQTLTGWRRAVAAMMLGLCATLALPPVHALILLLPAFVGLTWMIDAAGSGRRAFWAGWWFGLGHFASGLYWISHAMLVDAARFGWMIPFALGGLGAWLGLFTGAAALIAWRLARLRIATPLGLAASWLLTEWLRGHLLTGFPWNLAGTAWLDLSWIAGIAAWIGLYGLTALTVAVAASVARLGAFGTTIAVAVFTALSTVSLLPSAPPPAEGSGPRLRLVQPDIAQSLKWVPEERQRSLALTAALSRGPGIETIAHVIWPETATLFPLASSRDFMADLAQLVPAGGYLLTGSTRVEREPVFRAWNSLHALDASGEIRATFDKFHLVPFGEYVPLRGILPVEKIAPGPVDFSSGPGPRTIRLPGLPAFSTLICYEIIFPAAVVDRTDRPEWILNVTNDAWFGHSAGPYQHLAAAQFRAIEEGLPVVRAANGGISAVIDGHGRIRAMLALSTRGVIDASLPPALPPTLYGRFGDLLLIGVGAGLFLLGGLAGRLGHADGLSPSQRK